MNRAPARLAIVTGAAQGLGAGIARALHEVGHPVLLCDVEADAVGRVAAALAADGGAPARALQVDVRDKGALEDMVSQAVAWQGNVSILVNNAARTLARELLQITAEEWDDVLAVNLRSVLLASQAAIPQMRAQRWGRIINMASVAGVRGGPQVQGAHYATSKAGIIGLSRYMAFELAKDGIAVNAIAPGPILTEQTALAPPDRLAAVAQSIPAGRLGQVPEVGALVAYLASDAAGFMIGATLDINGGLVMR